MIRFEAVSLGSGQVSPCVRCAASPSTPLDSSAVIGALTEAAAARPHGVLLVGYEPFAHPALVEIIGLARGLGVPRIGLQTDGAALGLGQNAPGSIAAGVRFFEFVLLGGDAEAHDRLAGRSGAFLSLTSGIAAARREAAGGARVFVAATVRVCRHNKQQLAEMVSAAVSSGVRAVRIEVAEGVDLSRDAVDRAHVIATTAGVAMFGDRCDHLLRGARLYTIGSAPQAAVRRDGGEVTRG